MTFFHTSRPPPSPENHHLLLLQATTSSKPPPRFPKSPLPKFSSRSSIPIAASDLGRSPAVRPSASADSLHAAPARIDSTQLAQRSWGDLILGVLTVSGSAAALVTMFSRLGLNPASSERVVRIQIEVEFQLSNSR